VKHLLTVYTLIQILIFITSNFLSHYSSTRCC